MPLTSPPGHTLITANKTISILVIIWVPPCKLMFRGCGQQKVVLLLPYTIIIYITTQHMSVFIIICCGFLFCVVQVCRPRIRCRGRTTYSTPTPHPCKCVSLHFQVNIIQSLEISSHWVQSRLCTVSGIHLTRFHGGGREYPVSTRFLLFHAES